jgi:hypothetical protein
VGREKIVIVGKSLLLGAAVAFAIGVPAMIIASAKPPSDGPAFDRR